MKHFPIKDFSHGIECKFGGTNQDRGTLRKAEGINVAPVRNLSSAPTWGVAWGYADLVTAMTTALSGATANKVDFVTIQDGNGNVFLVAWDLSTNSPRGMWCVGAGTAAPNFASASGVSITATNDAIHRDYTAALNWYGSWIGGRLFLGNGTDNNLVWAAGALAVLGPASLPATTTPFKFRIPPCTCFAQWGTGVVFAAGNVDHPLRVFASDPPNAQYPTPDGLLTNDRSFCDLNRVSAIATRVTALSPVGSGFIAHLGLGGAVWVGSWNRTSDGNLLGQIPLKNCAGALNQACVANTANGTNYFGADLEIYTAIEKRAPATNTTEPRDSQIETWKSSGQWNREMTRGPGLSYQPFILDDVTNNRLWISSQVILKTQPATYVYDRTSHSSTGPHRYPSLICATPLLNQNLPGVVQAQATGGAWVVVGISAGGSLMYADLGLTGELALDAPGTAIGGAYVIYPLQQTPTKGLACVGVYDGGDGSMSKFVIVDSAGKVSTMADAWSLWVDAGSSVPAGVTNWFNDAQLAIVEFSPEDFGSPIFAKNYCEVRLNWRAMQRVYAGVAIQSGNQRDWRWLGVAFPDELQNAVVTASGTRCVVRLLFVTFNGAPCTLPDIGIGMLEGVAP